MGRFWVTVTEKHMHLISVDAPTKEAATKWAADESCGWIYQVGRETDHNLDPVWEEAVEMSEGDLDKFADDVEVFVDENGKEKRVVSCKFCHRDEVVTLAHQHDGGWVCAECWDERLKNTE